MLRQKKEDRRKNEDRGNLIHLRFAYVSVRLSHTGPGSGKLVALQPWCHYSPSSWAIFLVPPPFSEATTLPFYVLAQAAQGRTRAHQVCPTCVPGRAPHLKDPFVIFLGPPWRLLSQGKASLPPLVPWVQNKSSLRCPRERGAQTAPGSAQPGL